MADCLVSKKADYLVEMKAAYLALMKVVLKVEKMVDMMADL